MEDNNIQEQFVDVYYRLVWNFQIELEVLDRG